MSWSFNLLAIFRNLTPVADNRLRVQPGSTTRGLVRIGPTWLEGVSQVNTVVWTGVDAEVEVVSVPVTDDLPRIDNLVPVDGDLVAVTEGFLVDVEVTTIVDDSVPPHDLPLVVTAGVDV